MSPLIKLLQQADIFQEISERDLEELIANARLIDVPKGGVIYRAGDRFRYLVLLCSGMLQSIEIASDGRLSAIQRIRPLQLVGILYLFGDQTRHDSLVAIAPSEIVLLGVDKISSLMMGNAKAAFALCEKFTQIIHSLKRDNDLLSRPAASGRVLGVLSKFIVMEGDNYYLSGLPRQQEVADLANTTRETVSRTMSQLLSSRVIQKCGNKIQVHRLEMFIS